MSGRYVWLQWSGFLLASSPSPSQPRLECQTTVEEKLCRLWSGLPAVSLQETDNLPSCLFHLPRYATLEETPLQKWILRKENRIFLSCIKKSENICLTEMLLSMRLCLTSDAQYVISAARGLCIKTVECCVGRAQLFLSSYTLVYCTHLFIWRIHGVSSECLVQFLTWIQTLMPKLACLRLTYGKVTWLFG